MTTVFGLAKSRVPAMFRSPFSATPLGVEGCTFGDALVYSRDRVLLELLRKAALHSTTYFSSITSVRYAFSPAFTSSGASSPLLCQITSPDLRSRTVFSPEAGSVRS